MFKTSIPHFKRLVYNRQKPSVSKELSPYTYNSILDLSLYNLPFKYNCLGIYGMDFRKRYFKQVLV